MTNLINMLNMLKIKIINHHVRPKNSYNLKKRRRKRKMKKSFQNQQSIKFNKFSEKTSAMKFLKM